MTFTATQAIQIPKTVMNAPTGLIFFGLAAENPTATSASDQVQNNSSDSPNCVSHFGASSGKKDPRCWLENVRDPHRPYA